MNKFFLNFPTALIISVSVIILISCKKKEGCKVPNAKNYDSSAEKDDGSCMIYVEGNGVIDADSNVYKTVIIGNQEWMAENLKTTKYADGKEIPNVRDKFEWLNLTSGAWCSYNNDYINEANYGKLYNWYAVEDLSNLCPIGWHVPSDDDWTELTNYLATNGHNEIEGKVLKSTTDWPINRQDNCNGTNNYGWNGLPGGSRKSYDGNFSDIGRNGIWWSSSHYYGTSGRFLNWFFDDELYKSNSDKLSALSVRCIKD